MRIQKKLNKMTSGDGSVGFRYLFPNIQWLFLQYCKSHFTCSNLNNPFELRISVFHNTVTSVFI